MNPHGRVINPREGGGIVAIPKTTRRDLTLPTQTIDSAQGGAGKGPPSGF